MQNLLVTYVSRQIYIFYYININKAQLIKKSSYWTQHYFEHIISSRSHMQLRAFVAIYFK